MECFFSDFSAPLNGHNFLLWIKGLRSRKDPSNEEVCDASKVANVRSSMIGEIENRSSHLLALSAKTMEFKRRLSQRETLAQGISNTFLRKRNVVCSAIKLASSEELLDDKLLNQPLEKDSNRVLLAIVQRPEGKKNWMVHNQLLVFMMSFLVIYVMFTNSFLLSD